MTVNRKLSNHVSTGTVVGTGAEISVLCGFRPKAVVVFNATGLVRAQWNDLMPNGAMIKIVDIPAGTVAMTNSSDSAGTPSQSAGASNAASATSHDMVHSAAPGGPAVHFNEATGKLEAILVGGVTVQFAGTAEAQVITQATYNALSAHVHANTATFTGTASGMSYPTSNGITSLFNGFNIGADADLNVVAEVLFWAAMK